MMSCASCMLLKPCWKASKPPQHSKMTDRKAGELIRGGTANTKWNWWLRVLDNDVGALCWVGSSKLWSHSGCKWSAAPFRDNNAITSQPLPRICRISRTHVRKAWDIIKGWLTRSDGQLNLPRWKFRCFWLTLHYPGNDINNRCSMFLCFGSRNQRNAFDPQ